MIYGSVCSGIEAATVAWHPLGWKPAFFSETAKFPRAVLAHHYPEVPLHGDFTTIERGDYPDIDLLVGGTPCQDFSVAGLRKGLDGERGQLTVEFVRLAARLTPRWLLWENVPGVLTADKRRAFGVFLGALADCGYHVAWRVLDAQYFGVPQRRRRVFLVGYSGDWRPPTAVLFERESLSGNPAPSREQGQTSHTLSADGFDASEDGTGRGRPIVIAFTAKDDGRDFGFKSPTLRSLNFDKSWANAGKQVAIATGDEAPRYVTPREEERLQGLPDDYTLVSYRGKPVVDGPRYHACGNTMAVPVMKWLGQRIETVEQILKARAA